MRINWRIWVPCTLLGLLAVAGFSAYKWSGIGDLGAQLEERLAEAKKLGMATTPEELAARAAVPDHLNGAVDYAKVLATLGGPGAVSTKKLEDLMRFEAYGLTAAEHRDAQKEILTVRRELEVVARASKKPGLDFHRSWQDGPNLMFMEYAPLKSGAKYLAFRARLKSKEGDLAGALDDIEAIQRMSRQISQEPTLMAALVGISVDAIGMAALQSVTVQHIEDRPNLERALKVAQDVPIPDFRPSVSGELVMARQTLRMIANGQLQDVHGGLGGLTFAKYTSARLAMESKYLEHTNSLYAALPEDPMDFEATARAFEEYQRKTDEDQSLVSRMAGFFMYNYGEGLSRSVRNVVLRHRLAEAGIKLMLAGKPFPKTLPFEVQDPFTRKQPIYRSTGSGFVIYSFGPDMDDDGGRVSMDGDDVQGGDILWRYPFQPTKRKRPNYGVPPGTASTAAR